MKESIKIQNLKCGGCIHTILTKIAALKTISNVEIEEENAIISFEYRQNEDIDLVKRKLTSLGYPPIDDHNTILLKAKSMISCASGKLKKH